jgi:hypothetical protein
MEHTIKSFLETYELYQGFRPGNRDWWDGEWPDTVEVRCHHCGSTQTHRIWPSKVAGVGVEWGVYQIDGSCERCADDSVMFWVEVNQREGWMRKAGQLPAIPRGEAIAVAR